MGGGGNMDCEGVLGMEVAGVRGTFGWPEREKGRASSLICSLMADSLSLAVDSRRKIRGRLGVRVCWCPIRVFLPIACTSNEPDLVETL